MAALLCGQPSELGKPANCCPVPSCSLEFQTKSGGGGATLCGISEFASPSSPPKKYRRQDLDGGYCDDDFSGDCGGPLGNNAQVHYGGNYLYALADCAQTNNQTYDAGLCGPASGGCGSCGETARAAPGIPFAPSFLPAGHYTQTTTKQINKWEYDPNCYNPGGVGDGRIHVGTITATLNNEDTEDDAISRADAAIPTWTTCVPAAPEDCSTFKELRGAGVFNLAYRSSQVRIVAGAGVIGVTYNATITLGRRVHGSGLPFVDYGTLSDQHVGSGAPYTSDWMNIPADSGYEVAATGCLIEIGA